MPLHLESKDLMNVQQMEVAVNGPDGATHLILCTGIANLDSNHSEDFTFLVGPGLSRRQFVGAIASGAFARIQSYSTDAKAGSADIPSKANLVSISADYDEEFGQVKVWANVCFDQATTKLAISYQVSILAELSRL